MFKDDVTKQWSLSRISAFVTLIFNLSYSGYTVFITKNFPDLGNNWMLLVLFLYGLNKGATVARTITLGQNKIDLGLGQDQQDNNAGIPQTAH